MRNCVIVLLILSFLVLPVSALTVKDTTIGSAANSLITWTDHKGKERKVAIMKTGTLMGISAYMSYYSGTTKVVCTGSGTGDIANSGFGGIIHHNSGGASAGSFTQRLNGASVAIFDHKQTVDGALETVTYTFTDGNDYFQYAVTDDVRAGTGMGDTRTPYCSMNWDGVGGPAEGIEYGAKRYFKQPVITGAGWPNRSGPWTMSGVCDIPYAWEWANAREIGFIASQTFTQQRQGVPNWSDGMASSGTLIDVDGTQTAGNTKDDAGVTDYQMNFYDQWMKITWGQPYGWMNATDTWSAGALLHLKNKWGQYSLSILVDTKADSGVMRIRDENRAIHTAKVSFSASTGTVKDSGQIGTVNPAKQKLSPLGYDHNYRVWSVTAAASDQAVLNLNVTGTTPLINPTFRISGMAALPSLVTYNGSTLASGTGYYASRDATNGEVWLTIVGSFLGNNAVGVNMATPIVSQPLKIRGKTAFTAESIEQGKMLHFSFCAPSSGKAQLSLFDASGRLVAVVFDGIAVAGKNSVTWNQSMHGKSLIAEYSFDGKRQSAVVIPAGL
jgi:hypothetical protein